MGAGERASCGRRTLRAMGPASTLRFCLVAWAYGCVFEAAFSISVLFSWGELSYVIRLCSFGSFGWRWEHGFSSGCL